MAREHGQKSEAICKDGGANDQQRLIVLLRLLIAVTSLPVAFICPALSCHLLSSDNKVAAFAMSLTQKSLIVVRFRRNLESPPYGGLLTPSKQIREARSVAF